jgi:5-methylcytosine-specific restriction enzyme subunit McrC
MTKSRSRFQIKEYGINRDFASIISHHTTSTKTEIERLLVKSGIRIASELGLQQSPIQPEGNNFRVRDIAGILQLAPSIEIEIVPKFLNEYSSGWREDFYYLSVLSKHGRLLEMDKISSDKSELKDMTSLLARSFTRMYKDRSRRPLRSYRQKKDSDFFLDGEIEPENLYLPTPDGFEQTSIKYDRMNQWNAAIQLASKSLLLKTTDPSIASNLNRIITDLGHQPRLKTKKANPIPSRQKNWKAPYELSLDILNGLGISYSLGNFTSPGYLVSTWQLWEDLMYYALKLAFSDANVKSKNPFKLGERFKLIDPIKSSNLTVYPDYIVYGQDSFQDFVVDAKYKGNSESGPLRISEADIYESIAFCRASRQKLVILVYPSGESDSIPTGTCKHFETIGTDDLMILGVQINVSGISSFEQLKVFSQNLRTGILTLLSQL